MNPQLTHHHHQSPTFTLGFTLGVVHSMGLDKCMTCNHHYSITQNSFAALKILCALHIHPSPPSHPTDFFYGLHSFAYSRM